MRVLLDEIARTSADVAAASARSEKTRLLAECLGAALPGELPIAHWPGLLGLTRG